MKNLCKFLGIVIALLMFHSCSTPLELEEIATIHQSNTHSAHSQYKRLITALDGGEPIIAIGSEVIIISPLSTENRMIGVIKDVIHLEDQGAGIRLQTYGIDPTSLGINESTYAERPNAKTAPVVDQTETAIAILRSSEVVIVSQLRVDR